MATRGVMDDMNQLLKNTPFGQAIFTYDGESRVYVKFEDADLNVEHAHGHIILEKNPNDQRPLMPGRGWKDVTPYHNWFKKGSWSLNISAEAVEILRIEIVPWIRNYLEDAPNLFDDERNRCVNGLRNCEQEIAELTRKLAEKQGEREDWITALASFRYYDKKK
jgi:membrane carboxypeptidase/penicillin-binding protein PbpC